jgi:hypothetical protein
MNNEEIFYSQFLIDHENKKFSCNPQTAIRALRPTAKYGLSQENEQYVISGWDDAEGLPPPTQEEIEEELEFQQRFCDYWQFFYDRYQSYPDVTVLFNLLWSAIDNGQIPGKESEFYRTIKLVNEQYPAPDGEPPSRSNK